MKNNILIVASGTGGHVIPALNIADKLINKKYKITWIGTKNGIENKLIQNKSINLKYISSSGIRGKSILNKIKGTINFIKSIIQSLILIIQEKPVFIIGFGGYITTAVSIASFIMRISVYAHESNSIPGTANKINHLISKKTFETFPNTFSKSSKVILTGNPLKDNFKNITHPNSKYQKKDVNNILIFGGSQGARYFNKNIPAFLSKFKDKFKIKHICGSNNKESVVDLYEKYHMDFNVIEFSYEMDVLYNWADLIISRAGSMTLSEIAISGRASILVPYIYATDNHQYLNAKYLSDSKAAFIIEENDKFSDNLLDKLSDISCNHNMLRSMAINVKSLFPNNSSDIILENISELNEKYNNTTS